MIPLLQPEIELFIDKAVQWNSNVIFLNIYFRLYHCVENSREYHQMDQQYIEIDPEHAEIVESLIAAYPNYMALDMLHTNDMNIIQTLWENKLLMTRDPLDGDQYD